MDNLSICIAGWHYEPQFLEILKELKYNVHIISRREADYKGLACIEIEDVGLDFGAYSFYIDNVWDKKSNVLFCHDDSIVNSKRVFDKIAELENDVVFIFENERLVYQNWGGFEFPVHGRCVFVKQDILLKIGSIWFDRENEWKKEGIMGSYVNEGVYRFYADLKKVGADIAIGICPDWKMGYRGTFDYIAILT